jgi:hypothetical protein
MAVRRTKGSLRGGRRRKHISLRDNDLRCKKDSGVKVGEIELDRRGGHEKVGCQTASAVA